MCGTERDPSTPLVSSLGQTPRTLQSNLPCTYSIKGNPRRTPRSWPVLRQPFSPPAPQAMPREALQKELQRTALGLTLHHAKHAAVIDTSELVADRRFEQTVALFGEVEVQRRRIVCFASRKCWHCACWTRRGMEVLLPKRMLSVTQKGQEIPGSPRAVYAYRITALMTVLSLNLSCY